MVGKGLWALAMAPEAAIAVTYDQVHIVAVEIAVLAAALVGLREMWRRVVRPAWTSGRSLVRRVDAAATSISELPTWQAKVEDDLGGIRGSLEVIRDEDRRRVQEALAAASVHPQRTGWRE